jgi:hypothetical protein
MENVMPDWKKLKHAYGSAEDIPELLAQVTPGPESEVWTELVSRLCHQGSVYSASFAALPYLTEIAARWRPEERLEPLFLAASILSSDDVHVRGKVQQPSASLIEQLQGLCHESLEQPKLERNRFIYLMLSMCAFVGESFWARQLDQLVGGEFTGVCPGCSTDLYLVIGEEGFFVASEEWVRRPETRRTAIRPNEGDLAGVGQSLLQIANDANQREVSRCIRHVFGTSECPACGRSFELVDAIAATEGGNACL